MNKQKETILLTVAIYTAILALAYAFANFGGYEPKDQCANDMRRILSPYQISQLIEKPFPTSYEDVAEYCTNNLSDYSSHIREAKSWREFADPDMF